MEKYCLTLNIISKNMGNNLAIWLVTLTILLPNYINAENKYNQQNKKSNVVEELDLKLEKYHKTRKSFLNKDDVGQSLSNTTVTGNNTAADEQKSKIDNFKDTNVRTKKKSINIGIGTKSPK